MNGKGFASILIPLVVSLIVSAITGSISGRLTTEHRLTKLEVTVDYIATEVTKTGAEVSLLRERLEKR